MVLVRSLFFISATYNFELSAVYVPTRKNDLADSLSRLDIVQFKRLAPRAERYQTFPAPVDLGKGC